MLKSQMKACTFASKTVLTRQDQQYLFDHEMLDYNSGNITVKLEIMLAKRLFQHTSLSEHLGSASYTNGGRDTQGMKT
jgi:hypothetical protein